jgi:hypothetical protein
MDIRAFRYGIYVVPAYRTGRPKGTNTICLIVYFTHIMSLMGLWPMLKISIEEFQTKIP